MRGKFQTALRLIYPPRCVGCGDLVQSDFGLCGPCWRDTPFIGGLVCDLCGTPLPGSERDGTDVHCDTCLTVPRPWSRARAVSLYQGRGRKLVLALKHSDRTDVAHPAALWLAQAAGPLFRKSQIVLPVPLHRWRFLKRRYNQADLLARPLAAHLGLEYCADALVRTGDTGSMDGLGFDARFARLCGVMRANPARRARIKGRAVMIIDDVMTSGATLAAASEACLAAGASDVRVLVLARVAKDA